MAVVFANMKMSSATLSSPQYSIHRLTAVNSLQAPINLAKKIYKMKKFMLIVQTQESPLNSKIHSVIL